MNLTSKMCIGFGRLRYFVQLKHSLISGHCDHPCPRVMMSYAVQGAKI